MASTLDNRGGGGGAWEKYTGAGQRNRNPLMDDSQRNMFMLHHVGSSGGGSVSGDSSHHMAMLDHVPHDHMQMCLQAPPYLHEKRSAETAKKLMKRAANRKSASASRARKKTLLEEMTIQNERMKQHAQILAMIPDLIVTLKDSGSVSYVSDACESFLQYGTEEMRGMAMFELVTPECREVLKALINESLISMSPSQQTGTEEDSGEGGSRGGSSGDMKDAMDLDYDDAPATVPVPHTAASHSLKPEQTSPILPHFCDGLQGVAGLHTPKLGAPTPSTCAGPVPIPTQSQSDTGSNGSSGNTRTNSGSAWTSVSASSSLSSLSGGSGRGSSSNSGGMSSNSGGMSSNSGGMSSNSGGMSSNSGGMSSSSSSSGSSGGHPSGGSSGKAHKHNHSSNNNKRPHHVHRRLRSGPMRRVSGGKCRLCLIRRDKSTVWCEIRTSILPSNDGKELVLSLRPVPDSNNMRIHTEDSGMHLPCGMGVDGGMSGRGNGGEDADDFGYRDEDDSNSGNDSVGGGSSSGSSHNNHQRSSQGSSPQPMTLPAALRKGLKRKRAVHVSQQQQPQGHGSSSDGSSGSGGNSNSSSSMWTAGSNKSTGSRTGGGGGMDTYSNGGVAMDTYSRSPSNNDGSEDIGNCGSGEDNNGSSSSNGSSNGESGTSRDHRGDRGGGMDTNSVEEGISSAEEEGGDGSCSPTSDDVQNAVESLMMISTKSQDGDSSVVAPPSQSANRKQKRENMSSTQQSNTKVY